jgi:hypothetical protein
MNVFCKTHVELVAYMQGVVRVDRPRGVPVPSGLRLNERAAGRLLVHDLAYALGRHRHTARAIDAHNTLQSAISPSSSFCSAIEAKRRNATSEPRSWAILRSFLGFQVLWDAASAIVVHPPTRWAIGAFQQCALHGGDAGTVAGILARKRNVSDGLYDRLKAAAPDVAELGATRQRDLNHAGWVEEQSVMVER